MSVFPVISFGISSPITFKIVGAKSPNLPGFIVPLQTLSMMKNGKKKWVDKGIDLSKNRSYIQSNKRL